ncbi:hypothetical protein RD110_02095 [Rhodoferax koreense]|uniref:N-acetyltransferase domain-containing protein n=1 Tax=Rhodoferax koreensis TaxID=1842727 RepID=A0A1P8JQY8_9BURK|nr:hypothetical protein RD110_02095 [Rhodoferax koreense]
MWDSAWPQGGQILLCYALPEFLYQGVGRALLGAIELHAVARGDTQLRLESTCTALRFYERRGFSNAGAPISAFGMTAQPMSKCLSDGAQPGTDASPA